MVADVDRALFDALGGGLVPPAGVRVALPRKGLDLVRSYTWITVSPSDDVIALSLRDEITRKPELVVAQSSGGAYQIVRGARGPVAFTEPGESILSYREIDGATPPASASGSEDDDWAIAPHELLVIEPAGDVARTMSVPLEKAFDFHVSGALAVVAVSGRSYREPAPMFMIDTADASDEGTLLGPEHGGLHEFVERPGELWMIDDGRLIRLDLEARALEVIPLPFDAHHINWLPGRDWLVLDDPEFDDSGPARLVFFEPTSRTIVGSVPLE